MKDLKVAAYLDESGEDPATACATLVKAGIKHVALRSAWGHNICKLADPLCQKLKQLFSDNGISVVAIVSDLGKTEPPLAQIPKEDIDRAFNIAAYFQASFLRVGIGIKKPEPVEAVYTWAQAITDRCLLANLVPLLEVTNDASIVHPAELSQFFAKFRRWKLLYDPVQLILNRNQDPFVKYWTLLKAHVAAVDVRDFKIGYGYKPPGFGDARIQLTLRDCMKIKYGGWLFIEPSLGRRFGNATTKSETFHMALEAFENISHQS